MTFKTWAIGGVIVAVLAAGSYSYWKDQIASRLPEGIISSNGRIESGQLNISTEYSGRIVDIYVREGDMADAGQVLARLDTSELDARIRGAQAEVNGAEKAEEEALALVATRDSQLVFTKAELARARQLHEKRYVTTEKLDQRQNEYLAAESSMRAAKALVGQAQASLRAAKEALVQLETIREKSILKAPRRGRIQYRLAEPGEVLSAGGSVLTLMDVSDIYMTIFLPAAYAGQLGIGDEGRLVLDPAPDLVIPATVSFVAADAQFTPKTVETSDERSKLVFRVKLRVDPALLSQYEDHVKSGIRGMGYVRLRGAEEWPEELQVKLPK